MTGGFKGISSSSKTGSTISSSLEQLLVIGIELKCLTFLVFKISQFSHWKKRVKKERNFSQVLFVARFDFVYESESEVVWKNSSSIFIETTGLGKFQAYTLHIHISFTEKYHCCILQQELLRMRRLLLLLVEMEDTFSLSLSYVKICRDLPIFLLRLLCWYVILWCCVCLLKEILGYLQTHVTVVQRAGQKAGKMVLHRRPKCSG